MKTSTSLLLIGLVAAGACSMEESATTDETVIEDTTSIVPTTPAPVVDDSAAGFPDAGFEPFPSDSPGF